MRSATSARAEKFCRPASPASIGDTMEDCGYYVVCSVTGRLVYYPPPGYVWDADLGCLVKKLDKDKIQ